MSKSIVIVCPDTNVRLWATRVKDAAIGGGKSAILQLAAAWSRSGHNVTLACAAVVEGEAEESYRITSLENGSGSYDVAIYVTGSVGHFNHPAIERIHGSVRLFWINGPGQVSLPPGRLPDAIIAPARFLARRAIDEWGFPANLVTVIPGEAISQTTTQMNWGQRDEYSVVYASVPHKGLDNVISLIDRVRADYPDIHLDVYGSESLHNDELRQQSRHDYPRWVSFAGDIPQHDLEGLMPRYGLMLYVTTWIDGFSLATAEALKGGVIVIATAHGSNAEFIRHGWNGFLVASGVGNQPDLVQAEDLLRHYLASPMTYQDMRERAAASVPSWDEQAKDWERIWTRIRTAEASSLTLLTK